MKLNKWWDEDNETLEKVMKGMLALSAALFYAIVE
jgi:hypothetical protein